MKRGLPSVCEIKPDELDAARSVGLPDDTLYRLTLLFGTSKLGWFPILKASALYRRLKRSLRRNTFASARSNLVWKGPRNTSRPALAQLVSTVSPAGTPDVPGATTGIFSL